MVSNRVADLPFAVDKQKSVDNSPDRDQRTFSDDECRLDDCSPIWIVSSIRTGCMDILAAANIDADMVADAIVVRPIEAKNIANLEVRTGDRNPIIGLVT